MDKSYNDIKAQTERVIAMAAQLGGHWTANAKNRVDEQHFYQIGARARAQHGIALFVKDKDEKKPYIPCVQPIKPQAVEEPEPKPEPVKQVSKTPTEVGGERVNYFELLRADENRRKQLQDGCRHRFINKMYAELLIDMEVCKLEGWDALEFPRMLKQALQVCFPKPVQLSLF